MVLRSSQGARRSDSHHVDELHAPDDFIGAMRAGVGPKEQVEVGAGVNGDDDEGHLRLRAHAFKVCKRHTEHRLDCIPIHKDDNPQFR